MKRFLLPIMIACALALPAYAQDKHGDHAPKYGGVVVETKAGELELVAKLDLIQIYVGDHGKPIKFISGTGKATVFNGNEKTEAALALMGDRLEAKGRFKAAAGAKVLAEVSLNGKPAVSA